MRNHNLLQPGLLANMAAAATDPAPDGIKYWSKKNVGFACLNFFVTPESVGKPQPLVTQHNKIALVADIRLDNRDELIEHIRFHHPAANNSCSDTDLLLLAYKCWGPDCVNYLSGDFAFAIWDKNKQEILIARDCLGAKFLVYYIDHNIFAFSTNPASILALPFITPSINEDKVLFTLLMRSNNHEDTYFNDIHFCPPAHYLLVSQTKFSKKRYWDLYCDKEVNYKTDDQYTDHFLEILQQSVKDRLRCVGSVGLSLSGGCDSTLLAAIAARHFPSEVNYQKRLKTYSYTFDRFGECDERCFFSPLIERLNLDAKLIPGDYLWTFKDLPSQNIPRDDFFFDCYSNLSLSVVRHAYESGTQVLLDGQYGDTLFGGSDYFVSDLLLKKRLLKLLGILFANWKHVDLQHHIVTYGLRQLVPFTIKQLFRHFRPAQLSLEYYPGITEQRRLQIEKVLKKNDILKKSINKSISSWLPSRKYRFTAYTDPAWTVPYDSLVTRQQYPVYRCSPYFDRRLVEFMFALPTEQLSRPGRSRWIQRSAMKRLLPVEVVERTSKTRFDPLLYEGLAHKERMIVDDLSTASLAVKQGWVKESWLRQMINNESWNEVGCYALSNILHLELWLRSVQDATENDNWQIPFRYSQVNT